MTPDKPSVLLVGLGGLGSILLELMARDGGFGRIVVGSRNYQRGVARCNLTRLGALAQGYDPCIEFRTLDLNRPDAVAEVIDRQAPDVILSTATMQTWWLGDLLPSEAAVKKADFGMWLPVHLAPTIKLMEAVRVAGFFGPVLTAPFPDVVNCILARLGLAPTCGVGNVDEMVAKVRFLAAERLQTRPDAIRVFLVAHHAMSGPVFDEAHADVPPFFLRVEHDGTDVTEQVRADDLLLARFPIPSGPATHFLTAASTLRLLRALVSDRELFLHAPAPGGLPGGYPVLAGEGQVRPAAIPTLSLPEAISINERSHRFDGIERIENDGAAVFCPCLVETLKRELGYHCDRLYPLEAETRANELIERFREYAGRYGVQLPA